MIIQCRNMETCAWIIAVLAFLATVNGFTVVPSRAFARSVSKDSSVVSAQSSFSLRSTTDDRIEDEFASFAATLDSPPSNRDGIKSTKSWQTDLEKLLVDPKLSLAQRQVLISDLMNANAEIRESVTTAIRERKVCDCSDLSIFTIYFVTLSYVLLWPITI
jgi:hypothetical protein